MTAGYFLEQNQSKPVTQQAVKSKFKAIKSFERNQRVRVSQLDKNEQERMFHLITIAQHTIELLNEVTDELRDKKIIGEKHLISDAHREFLNLQKTFYQNAILIQSEERQMVIQQQQKNFEKFISILAKLDHNQFQKALSYINRFKIK